MLRRREQAVGWRLLNHATGMHDGDMVGGFRNNAEIMTDEHEAHAAFGSQFCKEIEDLRLSRHVQRRGRLIGEQDFRVASQRAGNHHALVLSARKFVWISAQAFTRSRHAYSVEKAHSFRFGCGSCQTAMQLHQTGKKRPDPSQGIHRCARILEYHGNAPAAYALSTGRKRRAVHPDRAGALPECAWQQIHDRQAGEALAGSGFTDDAECAAGRQLQRYVRDQQIMRTGPMYDRQPID
ncbi:MAG: hypothetical protein MnENMB40S_04250 [Rhizobiaceae bacterium MnEN-MB40S]|nr:MAG: hypothetical protein MnENMB40S_04250 [Rhizobiaceae bacterium MnEN-MB40S]